MGKFGQIYEQLLPNMSEIGMFQSISALRWKSRVYHNCCLSVIGPGTPDFGFEQEEAGPLLFLLQCETRAKEQTKT